MTTETPAPPSISKSDDAAAPSAAGTDEVDLLSGLRGVRRYWWVVVASVAVCTGIAAVNTHATKATYQASATVYAGQPVSPNGQLLNTISSKAATAIELAKGDDAIHAAATAAGVTPGRVRGGLAVTAITSPLASKLQTPPALLKITVRDRSQHVAQAATEALAAKVVTDTNTYASGKVKDLEQSVDAYQKSMDLLDQQRAQAVSAARSASGSEAASFAILATSLARESELTRADLEDAKGELAVAQELETSRVVTAPHASKVSSKAQRPTVVMGALAGLLLGLLVAWPLGRRSTRRR